MLLTNSDGKKVNFKKILEIERNVIIVCGAGSTGKTVFLKRIGKKPDDISRLNEHRFILHYECKNQKMRSIKDIFECLFQKMWSEQSMEYDDFELFVMKKNPLFLVDGYDQQTVNKEGNELLKAILRKENCRCIITTRNYSLKKVIQQCKDAKKTFAILTLKGIPEENFNELAGKSLDLMIPKPEENDRKQILEDLTYEFHSFYSYLGDAMHTPLTLQIITFWKIYDHFNKKNKSENLIQSKSLGKLFESLFSIKKELAIMSPENDPEEDNHIKYSEFDHFIQMFYKLCFKTYSEEEYDLAEETENKLKDFCKKLLVSKEKLIHHLLLIYFTETTYIDKNSYKFNHQLDQEFGCAKFLGEQVLNKLKNRETEEKELLDECIIWKFLFGGKNSTNILESETQEIKRFAKIILFLASEITRIEKNAFETTAEKFIDLAWNAGDSLISRNNEPNIISNKLCNAREGKVEKEFSHSSEILDCEDGQLLPLEKGICDNDADPESLRGNNADPESRSGNESDPESGNDDKHDAKIKEIDHKKEKYTLSTESQEDISFMVLIETNNNEHIQKALAEKLDQKPNWVIMNPVALPGLSNILEMCKPSQIIFVIDADPLKYCEFNTVLSILKSKKIEFSLQLNNHFIRYFDKIYSDQYIDQNLLMKEFTGKLSTDGIVRLPQHLVELHLSIDIKEIKFINRKLKELQNLKTLDLKVEVRGDNRIESLCFDGRLGLTIVVENMNASSAADVVIGLQPEISVKSSWLRELCFQNTSYSCNEICDLLNRLKSQELNALGSPVLKVWSSELLNDEEVKKVMNIADINGFGGFMLYRNLDKEAGLPKKTMKMDIGAQTNGMELHHEISSTERIQEIFKSVANESQSIEVDQLTEVLKQLHPETTNEEEETFSNDLCRSLFGLMDDNLSGNIDIYKLMDLEELLTKWIDTYNSKKDPETGLLSGHQWGFGDALRALNIQLPQQLRGLLVKQYQDKDGNFTMRNFIWATARIHIMINRFKRNANPDGRTATMHIKRWLQDSIYC